MSDSAYFKFLQDSKSIIDGNKNKTVDASLVDNTNDCKILDTNKKKYLGFVLQKSLEELDENLLKFENKYCRKGLKINWAVDYDDLLSELHSIMSKRKVKTAYYTKHYLYEEVGLEDFLKKQKIKYSESADVNFIEAQTLIADTGNLFILDNDMSNFKRLNNGSINIFIIGVEQLISSLADVEAYYNTQLAISQKGYNGYILYHPIKKDKDYLFIVDNGRSNMLNMQRQRVALNCLHCGRCAKVCPIYSVIGSEPYNNVFTGPIGNVVLPFFEDVDSYKHVSYACLLCGNCEKVCPVSIPIKDLIIENRTYFRKTKGIDIPMNSNYLAYKKFVTSRKKMNKSKILRNILLNKILSKAFRKKRKMPPLEKKSFNKQYILSLQNENK